MLNGYYRDKGTKKYPVLIELFNELMVRIVAYNTQSVVKSGGFAPLFLKTLSIC